MMLIITYIEMVVEAILRNFNFQTLGDASDNIVKENIMQGEFLFYIEHQMMLVIIL